MSSIYNKRYENDEKETQLTYKYTGQARILQACLDYKGTRNPLSCTTDGDNIRKLAQKAQVRDIVTIYDTGKT
jgi:hypothetical protein